jgi:hypothetical protein
MIIQYNKSLGSLYISQKTTDRAPDMKGKITIRRNHLVQMVNEAANQHSDAVIANIAAWSNTDTSGKKCLTIELQPRTPSTKRKEVANAKSRTIFDFIEEQNS